MSNNNDKKYKLNPFLPIIIIFGILSVLVNEIHNYQACAENDSVFANTELSGHILFISHSNNKAEYFGVLEYKKYYQVYLNEFNTNEPELFRNTASIGDSIVKHQHSDTLILFTSKGTHYYKVY